MLLCGHVGKTAWTLIHLRGVTCTSLLAAAILPLPFKGPTIPRWIALASAGAIDRQRFAWLPENDRVHRIVAHRLSTIAAMDRLIVLNQGKIVEEGNHAELLRRGGLYADLWSRQSGGFLPTGKPKRTPGEALNANEST